MGQQFLPSIGHVHVVCTHSREFEVFRSMMSWSPSLSERTLTGKKPLHMLTHKVKVGEQHLHQEEQYKKCLVKINSNYFIIVHLI